MTPSSSARPPVRTTSRCLRSATAIVLALPLLLALPPSNARATAVEDQETTRVVAPENTWTTRGGSPTRSGAAATAPLRVNPEVAWQFEAKGVITAEPLVLGDQIVLEVMPPGGRTRELHVLRLLDGAPAVGRKALSTDRSLNLSAAGRSVLAQTAPDTLQIFSLNKAGRTLSSGWKLSAPGELYAPLLVGEDELYVRTTGNEIQRYQPGNKEPVWRIAAARGVLRGEISVRDGFVYVVEYSHSLHVAQLVTIDRESGQRAGAADLGQHKGAVVPAIDAHITTTHAVPLITVRHAMPIVGVDGMYIATALKPEKGGQPTFQGLLPLATEPVAAGAKIIGMFTDGGLTLDRVEDLSTPVVELASASHHSWILEDGVPPSIARDTVYLGDKAFDLHTGEVLWSKDFDVSMRAIPARETVLLVTDGATRLVALRTPPRRVERGAETVKDGEFWGRVARRDGSIESGTLRIDVGKHAVQRTKGRTPPTDLDEVLAIVDRGGEVLFAPDGPSTAAGLRYLIEDQDGDDLALVAAYAAALVALEDRERPFTLALVEAILSLDPVHADAVARIRSLLPDGLRPDEPINAHGWLEFLSATATTRVSLIGGEFNEGDPGLTQTQRQLGAARAFWRNDLQALESDTLLVMTPLVAPGRIARCMAMGELVCEALFEIFSAGGASRDTRFPLQLQLFESQKEYIDHNTRDGTDPASLEWTSGHYDPTSDVSRIFLPEDREAFDQVMHVYAHELTHHWLSQRCPLFSAAEKRHSINTPGYWVVEGFASLVEEFRFDIDARTYITQNPRADSLDMIAHTKAVHDWKTLLALTQLQFHKTDTKPSFDVTTRWTLGAQRPQSARTLFYHQSTAICQYLFHAEEGKYRASLLEIVRRYYTGTAKPDDVQTLTGMEPDTLGKRVFAYAEKTVKTES